MNYLLDTNVLSELVRKDPSPKVVQQMGRADRSRLYTSSVCFMELRRGGARPPEGKRIWHGLTEIVLSWIQVLPFGREEALHAGEVMAELEQKGTVIGLADAMIGAVASINRCALITRNIREFQRFPKLSVENWFES